jgi:hypothetical protein
MIASTRTAMGAAAAVALALSGWLLSGCAMIAPAPPAADSTSAGATTAKMTAQPAPPPAPGRRVSRLLDFEAAEDLTFIASDPSAGAATIDSSTARGGSHCLLLPPGGTALTIKTDALLQGRPFPADWTLLGGYILSDRPTYVSASLQSADGKSVISWTVGVSAGAWIPVMIDLAPLGGVAGNDVGTLHLQFSAGTGATVRLDDVMLVDNQEVLVDSAAASSSGWKVSRKGLYYIVDAPGRFSFRVPTAQAQAGGWSAIESCDQRVRFASTAPPGTMTIYPDGRLYWGREFRPAWRDLRDAPEQAQQHASPGEIAIAESMGRVNRSTSGDIDNDGYNESRGS